MAYIIPIIERTLAALLALTLGMTLFLAATDPGAFRGWFAAEDGIVEYGAALFLLISALVLWRNALSGRAGRPGRVTWLTLLYGFLFLFAAGEEISWGQRILGIQTPDLLAEHNDQGELTLHNLVVGGVKLDEVVFGNLLSLAILAYLLVLPFVWRRWAWVGRFVSALAVPVPQPRHAAAALVATLIIGVLTVSRKWEVYELCFALLALAVFLAPQNPGIYTARGYRSDSQPAGNDAPADGSLADQPGAARS